MFVALRDLRHARGRFALISTVVLLVAVLVTFLSSLTAGLARASVSALTDLPADRLAFGMAAPGDKPDLTSSRVTQDQWQAWSRVPGVGDAQPLGIATTRATSQGDHGTTVAVTAFGVEAGSDLAPGGGPADGQVVVTRRAADALSVAAGGALAVDGAELTVTRVVADDAQLSHTPVVWVSLADWQQVGARGGGEAPLATVVALTTTGRADEASADGAIGTTTVTTSAARSAVSSFTAENLSLTTMQAFLVAISALVVGAFFTVWTISRQGDVAVLKALGASTGYLLRDALGQAALILVGAVAVGAGLAAAAGSALAAVLPMVVSPATTLAPAALLVVLGLVGAAAAVARITRTDPHAALAAR
ncbi:ABC transporter substrate-binding protein [Cellulomonas algicola]|uniref:ABC transporter substrate-binding protein n=1 Tax=Cellulomonas algicola TaxID=2071633 RepID=A0A401UVY1_9CELL|nr:ABC transporter permease [Cellulomonas algicola]GCD18734.1 ABC transporter substrate-binding protein [Cellulomonas algicola]